MHANPATLILDIGLLLLLLGTAWGMLRLRNIFAVVMLSGFYSLLIATFFVQLDAVDVAFTEAAVGGGISTVLMLATLALTRGQEHSTHERRWPALLLVGACGALLVYASLDFPQFADPQAPVHQHVGPDYIAQGAVETGVPNLVTAVLASYRGYDTLGEVTVIFTAAVVVLFLIGLPLTRDAPSNKVEAVRLDEEQQILRVVTKLLVPLILLFALYVQFHGDYGPGGGFQAGVIFATGIVLYGMVFGLQRARRVVGDHRGVLDWVMVAGVLLYAGVGAVTLLLGGNYLDYDVLAADDVAGQHLGILLIELGVGICVAAVMMAVFFAFATRGRRADKAPR